MLQQNPNFTETVGTLQAQTANFNGMQETQLYNDAEKAQLQHNRPTDGVVQSIYDQPQRRMLLSDFQA